MVADFSTTKHKEIHNERRNRNRNTRTLRPHICSLPMVVILPVGVFGLWVLGALDIKLGFLKEESQWGWNQTPQAKLLSDALPKTERTAP